MTTDEERERKAETTSPGTYNVVVNPESFQHLPEYTDDLDVKGLRLSPLRRGSLAASMASSLGRESVVDGAQQIDGMSNRSDDPDIVILRRFEDASRRATLQWKDSRSPTSPQIPTTLSEVSPLTMDGHTEPDHTPSLMERAAEGGQDSNLLRHFRNHTWRQLAQVESEKNTAQASNRATRSGVEVLEHAARFFPPVSVHILTDGNSGRFLKIRILTAREGG